jgi:hypothetical protein
MNTEDLQTEINANTVNGKIGGVDAPVDVPVEAYADKN